MSDLQYGELAEDFDLKLSNHSIRLLRIKDIDKLFDKLLSRSPSEQDVIDERMPYWAASWPSAIGLSKFIDEQQALVKGKAVIEIGCGLGLPGIVAALNGANVTMTDYLQEALDFARSNWQRNVEGAFHGQLLDWRDVSAVGKADVVLASDVAYESRSFEPLINALKSILKPDGELILSEPNRQFASPFIHALENDFKLEKTDLPVSLDGVEYNISVYCGRKR